MTQITAGMVKELRERTGVGMGKCKEALVAASGDIETAISNLRKAGMASAVKKESRETNEGIIKIAENAERVALIEINAETDFVVKNENFQAFAEKLAQEACKHTPDSVDAFLASKCSHDPALTIDEYRATIVQSLGENIRIKRIEFFPKKNDHSLAYYSHAGGKLVTLIEISGGSGQEELAKDIAMHVAAESPEYISSNEVPERVLEHEREIAREQVKNKPANIIDKIVDGKLNAYFNEVCLLNQKFIKDPSLSVQDLLKQKGAGLTVSQFLRWSVGE